MATLEYIELPIGATRLRNSAEPQNPDALRPAPKVTTSMPIPSPPSSPPANKRRASVLLAASSLTSPTMSFFPQLLLSAALPPTAANPTSTPNPSNPGNVTLLSSKDPLSLPIMSTNFKRFVSIVGPVFWLQDRIEEIVLWKRGWMWTALWMTAYTILCLYPRLILLIPHVALIGIILATYPYPATTSTDPLSGASPTSATSQQPITEGSVPWQANIQGIQNLMGAIADAHALVEPHVYHLCLTPQHLSNTSQKRSNPSHPSPPRSPYTTHILTLLLTSFFPLMFIIHLPVFPIRQVCLVAGLLPFLATHPYVLRILPQIVPIIVDVAPFLLLRFGKVKDRAMVALRLRPTHTDPFQGLNADWRAVEDGVGVGETSSPPPVPLSMIIQRVMDDDRLSDECWNAEMREVQLWENERFGGPLPADSPTLAASSSSSSAPPSSQKGWSKANLRPGERSAWSRGRDGWSGIGVGGSVHASSNAGGSGGGGGGVEGTGEVSSNLTFSLAPGWRFVESEDWRRDAQCAWSGCGGDPDGWVYTNDAWLGTRPAPYTSGGGSVTRRRRWIRRVWYDQKRASEDS